MRPLNNHLMPKTSTRGSHTRHNEPTWLRPCGVTVHHQLLLCFDLVITQCPGKTTLQSVIRYGRKTETFNWCTFNQFTLVKKHSEKCEMCPQERIQSAFTVNTSDGWIFITYFTFSFLAKKKKKKKLFWLFLCHVSVILSPVKHKK